MIRDLVAVLLIVYASIMRPKLPDFIISIFDSGLFRIIMITLISYMANRSLSFSILLAVGFVVMISLIKEQLIYEGFIEGMEDMEGIEDMEMPKVTSEMPGTKKKSTTELKKKETVVPAPSAKPKTEVPPSMKPKTAPSMKPKTEVPSMKPKREVPPSAKPKTEVPKRQAPASKYPSKKAALPQPPKKPAFKQDDELAALKELA